jgi:ribosome-binding protein aMBF1 (putative translation factor)
VQGWSQQELARLIDVKVSKIQEWEDGIFYPETDDLRKLSRQFEKDICS